MRVLRYQKPLILSSIPLDNHAVIEASAGTGKTYTLEHVILDLVLRGVTLDQILVVTFTEKATAELRIRVRARLEELLLLEAERDAGDIPDDRAWLLDDEARARLSRAIQSFDSATIATIHSFCQRVLTEHAFANRRLFSQEQVDGRHAFGHAFKEALRAEFAREASKTAYLRAALVRGYGVDGLEERLYACHTSRGALRPAYDEAALESALLAMREALGAGLDLRAELKAAKVHGATVNAVLDRFAALAPLVEAHAGHRDAPRFLQEFELLTGARKYAGDKGLLTYPLEKLSAARLGTGQASRLLAASGALQVAAVPLLSALAQVFLPRVRARLERRKRDRGLFDFDDMLSLVRDSLRGPHGEALARALRARYRYALIDEFQDTDDVQWEIFRRVFFESERQNLLYLIGDPKQAIYGFRGADVHTYVGAVDEVSRAGGARIALDQNFRSTGALIDAYNQILDQSAPRPYFGGRDIRYDRPVRCGDPGLSAVDSEGNPAAPVHLFELTGKMGTEGVWALHGARIAREITSLLDPARPALLARRAERSKPLRAQDIYVLTWSRREGQAVSDSLRASGVPHAFYKQDGLFDREEARHVLDLLAAIDDPHSPGKRLRAWLTPFFGLSLDEAHLCRDVPGDHPLMSRLFSFHALGREKHYERLFTQIVEETGILRRELFWKEGERELTNYLHIFEILLEEVGRARCTVRELYFTLKAFVEDRRKPLGENPGVQRLESDREAVQIMTMHKSKGLEAEVVFLFGGLMERRTPRVVSTFHDGKRRVSYIRGRGCPPEVDEAIAREAREEDERLLYVALTRAKLRLYLPYFPSGADFQPTGVYARVSERLLAMTDAPGGAGPLFVIEPVARGEREAGPRSRRPEKSAPPPGLSSWSPPEALVEDNGQGAAFRALASGRRGLLMTSYTHLQRGYRVAEEPTLAEQEGEGAELDEKGPDDLPGGAASGIFLHDVIEALPFETLAHRPRLDDWLALPEIARLFEAQARGHDIEARFVPHAARLIHAALTSPIDLGPSGVVAGLSGASQSLREMEFLYPLPESSTLALSPSEQGEARGPLLSRGFVKGFIDFLFEHDGKSYFADWKSDGLRSFGPRALAAHVEGHYPRQAQLYSLALVRMLGIRSEADYEARFGGLLYLFLRAMPRGPGEGVYFRRPAWADILAWEQDLTRVTAQLVGARA